MSELPKGKELYEVRWVGNLRCRSHGRALEYFTLLRSLTCPRWVGLWLGLERLPFTVLGSRWHEQTAVEHHRPPEIIQVSTLPVECRALLPADFAADDPWVESLGQQLGRAWCFLDGHGTEYWLPMPELGRTHYLFDSRLLPSITGGVVEHGRLTGRARQAWFPDQSGWVDRAGGHARFSIAPFLDDEAGYRVARLHWTPSGRDGLRALFNGFRRLRLETQKSGGNEVRRPWPVLPLPYEGVASWTCCTESLRPGPDGRRRRLVLQLLNHAAAAPWRELTLDRGIAPRAQKNAASSGNVSTGGPAYRLEPIPAKPVDVAAGKTDGRYRPLQARDFATTDQDAQFFRSSAPPAPVAAPGRKKTVIVSRDVPAAGSDPPGAEGADKPAMRPGSSQADALSAYRTFGNDLRPIVDVAIRTLSELADAPVASRYLPSRSDAYRFILPAKGRTEVDQRTLARSYLVVEFTTGPRAVYLVEPARRSESDHFPIGIVQQAGHQAMAFSDIAELARHVETQHRLSQSWIGNGALPNGAFVYRIDHPPAEQWKLRETRVARYIVDVVLQALSADRSTRLDHTWAASPLD